MVKKKDYCYAVEAALNELGGKWKPLILYVLIDDKLRFNEIHKVLPSITSRMLTKQLRELESDNLIHREVYAEVPPRVEYSLTKKGHSVIPVLEAICKWGEKYCL